MLVRSSPTIRLYMALHALHLMTAHAMSALHTPGNSLHNLVQVNVWQLPVSTVQM